MKDFVNWFIQIENFFTREKGPFSLFALFLRENASDRWDVLVAAPWIDADRRIARALIAERIQDDLPLNEIVKVSRVVLISEDNPALESFHDTYLIGQGIIEASGFEFAGLDIERAYIITSQRLLPNQGGGKDKIHPPLELSLPHATT